MDEMDHNGPEFRYQVEVQGPDDKQFVVHEVRDSKATEIKIPVTDVYKYVKDNNGFISASISSRFY